VTEVIGMCHVSSVEKTFLGESAFYYYLRAMVSSLAAQLAQGASLNANLLGSQPRRRHYAYTYMFTEKEAAQHDLDSIYALAQSGYTALLLVNPKLSKPGEFLISNAARTMDRTVMSREQVNDLRLAITAFLRQLSKYLLESPTNKVMEWLVRRFRYASHKIHKL
jgi:U3 small nucleolar RNA-associated protein 10